MPLNVGSRLGPYDILSPPGAGGFGKAVRSRGFGKHLKAGRPVAVTSRRRCGPIEGESYAANEWVSERPAAETAAQAAARVALTFSNDADRRARCVPGPRHSKPAPRSDPSSSSGERFPTERSGYRTDRSV
jgi:hypothetical protein